MKKNLLLFTLTICSLILFSCEKDKNHEGMLKPQVSFQQDIFDTEINIPVIITPTITNEGKQTSYKWVNGDKVLSTENTLSFTPTEMKVYTISLTITTEYGESSAQCLVKTTPASTYRNAVFMLDPGARGDNMGPGNESERVNARLMAIKRDGIYEDDAFGKANKGEKLGYHCVQPVIFGNKIYILSDAGFDNFDQAELVIADANTLKLEKSIQIEKGREKVTSLAIVSDQKAYIETGGKQLFSVDLKTGQKGDVVQGLPRNFSGSILTPLLLMENKLYGVSSNTLNSEICMINTENNVVSITSVSNSVSFMLPETNGRLLLLTEGMMDWGAKNLSIYSTESNSCEGKEQILPDNVFSAAAVSPKTKDLFFHSKKNKGEIYKYNYESTQSELFTSIDDVEFARLYVDTNSNKLYYTIKLTTGVRKFKTMVYDLLDNTPAKSIGKEYEHSAIDIYYALSY